jgi:hypothetical protein
MFFYLFIDDAQGAVMKKKIGYPRAVVFAPAFYYSGCGKEKPKQNIQP